jgi:hypothetical protein
MEEEEEKVPSGVKRNPTQEQVRESMSVGTAEAASELAKELAELEKIPAKFLGPKDAARKKELERRIKIEEAKRRRSVYEAARAGAAAGAVQGTGGGGR